MLISTSTDQSRVSKREREGLILYGKSPYPGILCPGARVLVLLGMDLVRLTLTN
jgi:hypothetical protein